MSKEFVSFVNEYNDYVVNEYGTWEIAIDTVLGSNRARRAENVRKAIVSQLRKIYEENGVICSAKEYKEKGYKPIYQTVVKHFKSWENALNYAKIPIPERSILERYSDEDIIKSIREFYNEYGGNISEYKYKRLKRKPGITTITRRFGTWNKALEAAKIDKANKYKARKISNEEIIDILKKASREIEGEFNSVSYGKWAKERNHVTEKTIMNRFGKWGNAVKEAGIQ